MSFCYRVIRSFLEFSFSPLCASDALLQNFCPLFVMQSGSEQSGETGDRPESFPWGMLTSGGKTKCVPVLPSNCITPTGAGGWCMCVSLHSKRRTLLLYTGCCGQIDTTWIHPVWWWWQFSVVLFSKAAQSQAHMEQMSPSSLYLLPFALLIVTNFSKLPPSDSLKVLIGNILPGVVL